MNKTLIIFPSWEERSILGFQRDIEKYPQLDKVTLFSFEHSAHAEETRKAIADIQVLCVTKKINFEEIILSNSDVEKWHKLDEFAQNLSEDSDIFIDITTMSRSVIWMLLFFFRQKFQQITTIYHKPENYNNAWLSKDPDIPQLLFKHSGIIEFGKPTTLLILSGYDEDRVIQSINYYEPQNIIIGRCNQRKNFDYCVAKAFDAPQYDDNWGQIAIEKEIEEILKTSNLIVASLGPKTGAISIYECFMKYPEIALAYVPCKEFNIDYCKGIGETLIKEVNLNK